MCVEGDAGKKMRIVCVYTFDFSNKNYNMYAMSFRGRIFFHVDFAG